MKKHILVVDNDQLILYGLAKALTDDGCEVKTADTTTEAIEKLSHCPYDVCLLDVKLADLNGLGLVKVINDICPQTKVIMMAADPLESLKVSEDGTSFTDDQGGSHWIPKPFALDDVTDIVNQVLTGEWKEYGPAEFFRSSPGTKSRKHPRNPFDEEVGFGISIIHEGIFTRFSLKGQGVDLSDGGIGLLTAYPLRENQVIGFGGEMDNKIGIVAWSRMMGKESFRVGVRFA